MVMNYFQEFECCHGILRMPPEEASTIFIRVSAVESADPYHEGFVRLYLLSNRTFDVVADIKEVVEWVNFYAPSVDV